MPKDMAADKKVDILTNAHSVILLSLTDEVLREVVDLTAASGLWDKLCDKYQNNSLKNMLYQKQMLYTLRMSGSTHVKDHLDNLNRIIFDLQRVNLKIEDED